MKQMGAKGIRRKLADGVEELTTVQGKNGLVFYLVSRFILVMVIVTMIESAVVWLESSTFLPLLQKMTSGSVAGRSMDTSSALSLVQWLWALLRSLLAGGSLALAGGLPRSVILRLVVAMLLLLIIPLLAGALAYSYVVVRKIQTLQEQRELELKKQEEQRNQFITDVAHDLRTPLMAISGMSHALADGLVRDEDQRDEYLQSICSKADKMGSLVNAVFDYTKLGSGSFQLHREELDLTQLLLREVAGAYTDAEDAGMRLTFWIPEEPCPILADQVQLSRVVSNLITNAIRHSPEGTEVSVLLVRQAATAFVMVADTGVPIQGDAKVLFQPFAQGDQVRPGTRIGSGLGLSICKKVADMHGFALSVAQPYGRFTKAFVLQCPLCR